MMYRDQIMHYNMDELLDDAEKMENNIYDLLDEQIHISKEKNKAINISMSIIDELNKIDGILNELCVRLDSSVGEVKRLNELRKADPYDLEKGKSKLEKFKFTDNSERPVAGKFNASDLTSLIEDAMADEDSPNEEDNSKVYEESDFSRLVKDFVGSRIKCD